MSAHAELFETPPNPKMPASWECSAKLSDCGTYRYELRRWWGTGAPVAWLMLNPSTADAKQDDPTLRRIIGFSYRWGYGGLIVVNLYPFRSSNPADLWRWCQQLPWWEKGSFCPYARDAAQSNRGFVECAARESALRVVAFGAAAERHDGLWIDEILEDFGQPSNIGADERLYCIGTSKSGAPVHPLARGVHRVPDDAQPRIYAPQ